MSVPAHFSVFGQAVQKSLDQLKQDCMGLRTNRVSPNLLDRVRVNAYGGDVPIQQVATIGVMDARTLEIRPWDTQVIAEIEKALQKSDIGVSPNNDGHVLRLNFPALTQERRGELAKIAKKYAEEARVRVRNARRDAQEEAISKALKDKKITEDEKFRRQTELDGLTNKFIADIDHLLAAKEKEIFEV